MSISRIRSSAFALLLTLAAGARAADENLADLDLATLMSMDVTVTSATRRAQSSGEAAAAVTVITREDIRRSGAATIPELLRAVPGLQVARFNTRGWAVSARGYNTKFANKLQVMIDGRSIYSPIFSGVAWEEQHVPLEEIERIEVVRGPGGALWGINAVNGVINIITRAAHDTRGLHVSSGGGTQESEAAGLRYGLELAQLGALRMYADYANQAAFDNDLTDLKRRQAGLRFERASGRDRYTLQADVIDSAFGDFTADAIALPASATGMSTLASWRREHARGGATEVRAYYAQTDRGEPTRWEETMLGLDAQYDAARVGRHLFTIGMGVRQTSDHQRSAYAPLEAAPASMSGEQWSVYAQDEIHFLDDDLHVILGAKLEDSWQISTQLQPTARVLWRARDEHTFWAAASRAARAPSRIELHSDVALPMPIASTPPLVFELTGDGDLDVERLDAYEAGWRWRPVREVSFDLALFRNEFSNLVVQRREPLELVLAPRPHIVKPLVYSNEASAVTSGVELAAEWVVSERLRLQAAAHTLDHDIPASERFATVAIDPEYAASLAARVDLPRDLELDARWRTVEGIDHHRASTYQALDLRLGWQLRSNLHIALAVDNLFDDKHREFADEIAQGRGVMLGREVHARVWWRPAF